VKIKDEIRKKIISLGVSEEKIIWKNYYLTGEDEA